MQQILGMMRKAITDYQMISDGDRVLVGISGGKDSVVLFAGLCRLRQFIGIDYQLHAVTLDPGFGGVEQDYTPIQELCSRLEVPYLVKRTGIGPIVFDARQETNPCSLCARMRRGALHDTAKELGCNLVALGHHYNDAVETFLMNLFNEGRLGCFSPVTYLSRKDLTMIRPLVLAPEHDISRAVRRAGLPVVKNPCPVDRHTNREATKEFLRQLERQDRGITKRIFGAMVRAHLDNW